MASMRRGPGAAPGGLMAAGAAIAIVGSLLTWFNVTTATDEGTIRGTEMSIGIGAIVLAAVVLIGSAFVWRSASRGWAIAGIVLSTFLLIVAAYAAFAPEDALAQFAATDVGEQLGISETAAEAAIEAAILQGALSATAAIGAYLAAAGGLLALLGSIMGVGAARRARVLYAQSPIASESGYGTAYPPTGTGGVAPPPQG